MKTTDEKIRKSFNILGAWLTQEVLSPQAIPTARDLQAQRRKMILFSENAEPWCDEKYKKGEKEKAVYWMVYLGQVNLQKSVENILKFFPDEYANEKIAAKGNTTLGVILLNEHGILVPENTYLSSFAWGYGKVINNRLNELADFEAGQEQIMDIIGNTLTKQDNEGNILPVKSSDIQNLIRRLAREMNIPQNEVLSGFSVRVPQFSAQEAPRPELLNSFFIEDLVTVKKALCNNDIGDALGLYMGISQPKTRRDINKDKGLLSQILSPQNIPLARWPGKGKYPLHLMQQAAVNHVSAELQGPGIVAVNGPPGTGKTTLLRDIIAKVVLDRAVAMSKFEDPSKAFQRLTSIKLGKSDSPIYTLDQSLLGHEIVMASSNNKAVENISKEIPSESAIGDDIFESLNYFRTVSDYLVSEDTENIQFGATWGLAAAVLGNSKNRNEFISKFWWDSEYGMRVYLNAIVGNKRTPMVTDEGKDKTEEETAIPFILENEECPKSKEEALEKWKMVRQEFIEKYHEAQGLRKVAEDAQVSLRSESKLTEDLARQKAELEEIGLVYAAANAELKQAEKRHEEADEEYKRLNEQSDMISKMKPGFFARLFHGKAYDDWYSKAANAYEALKESFNQVGKASLQKKEAEKNFQAALSKFSKSQSNVEKAEESLAENRKKQKIGRDQIGPNFADDEFWAQSSKKLQESVPWLYSDFQRARDELFVASFKLHRAFVEAAAGYIGKNLSAALEMMKGRSLSNEQEPARQSLWASIFLVVPVLSTTLASISRMFGPLKREQLGWLLIDEAGQATPQSIIGALWRSKKAVVIGDPLQIEPVVTMPQKLMKSIFSNYEVSMEEWAAPSSSAQEVADRSSWLGAWINPGIGERWVGSPLRVHRRCEEPMFSISNKVAYDDLMIYATQSKPSEIRSLLGDSCWFNVEGDCTAKWAEKEGEIVLQILKKIVDSGIYDPDIYLITPFRNASYNLRETIAKSHILENHISIDVAKWISSRVGTVHTFQGKEAEAVIFVLGASDDSSSGARNWAGSTPNLVNVAVTRAKAGLYVVGNRKSWETVGNFKVLVDYLPVKE